YIVSQSTNIITHSDSNGRSKLVLYLAIHDSYQHKRTYVSSRPTCAENIALQETYRTEWLAAALQAGYPDEIARPLIRGFAYRPGVAVTLLGKERCPATPARGAGHKMAGQPRRG